MWFLATSRFSPRPYRDQRTNPSLLALILASVGFSPALQGGVCSTGHVAGSRRFDIEVFIGAAEFWHTILVAVSPGCSRCLKLTVGSWIFQPSFSLFKKFSARSACASLRSDSIWFDLSRPVQGMLKFGGHENVKYDRAMFASDTTTEDHHIDHSSNQVS